MKDYPMMNIVLRPIHMVQMRRKTCCAKAESRVSRRSLGVLGFLPALPPLPNKFPALAPTQMIRYEEHTLSNGLRVFSFEDREVSLVSAELKVKGGQQSDPTGMSGLAVVTSECMRTGGIVCPLMSSTRLDDILEQKEQAAFIETRAGGSLSSVSSGSLPEEFSSILPFLGGVVSSPAFSEPALNRAKEQIIFGIQSRYDRVSLIPSRCIGRMIYGSSNPLVLEPSESSIQSLSVDDLVRFHQEIYQPKNSLLGVVGEFETKALVDMLEDNLTQVWKPSDEMAPSAADIESYTMKYEAERSLHGKKGQLLLINQKGLNQCYISMGMLGVSIDDPDEPALGILSSVMNGFGGRLFNRIRTQEGLAYSVQGGWSAGIGHRGDFVIEGESATESCGRFLDSVESVLNDLRDNVISDEELESAKAIATNRFVFNFAGAGRQMNQILTFDCLGLDQKLLFNRLERLQAVTKNDLFETAQRRLANLNDLDVVIVGDIQNASTYLNSSSFFAARKWRSSSRLAMEVRDLPMIDVSAVHVS